MLNLKYRFQSEGFKKYFINTSWVLAEKIIRIISSLVVGIWVARYLKPEGFGIIGYASSLMGILMAFSSLGLNSLLVRNLVKSKDLQNSLLGTAMVMQTFGSVFIMIILTLYFFYSSDELIIRQILLILGLQTFLLSFNIIDSYFQSCVQSKYVVYANIISLLTSSLLKICFILYEYTLIYFVWIMLIETTILAVGLIYFYQQKNKSIFNWTYNGKIATALIKDSWPLILNGIIVSIYMRIDQVMIKIYLSGESVGQYAAAARLSEAVYFIPAVISSSLFPAIVNAKKNNETLYFERLQNLYDLMVWLAILYIIPISLTSDFLVNMLYGSDYYQAAKVLKIHAWTSIFVFLGVARGGWVLNENLQKYSSMYLALGMIMNLLLNFIFIPKYGINGAAIATLCSQATAVLFAPLLFKPTRISFHMMFKSIILLPSIIKLLNKYDSRS